MPKPIPKLTDKNKERFWSKVEVTGPDDCWLWSASRVTGKEYGEIRIKGSLYKASRISYFIEFGFISDDLLCLHSCDNPPCVNPRHIFQGTDQDNMDDMYEKRRSYHPYGNLCGKSKLKEKQVLTIILRCKNRENQEKIAQDYGVSRSLISHISTGKNWKHLSS